MNRFHLTLAFSLALPAMAQTPNPGFDVQGTGIQALDGLKKATHKSLGWGLGIGYSFVIPSAELPVRVGITSLDMPGAQFGSIRSDLKDQQIHADVYLGPPSKAFSLKAGLSVNKYSASNQGAETWVKDPRNPSGLAPQYVYAVTDSKGLKLGLRVGADLALSPRSTLEILFQATELSGGEVRPSTPKPQPNYGAVNPAWLQFGYRYTF